MKSISNYLSLMLEIHRFFGFRIFFNNQKEMDKVFRLSDMIAMDSGVILITNERIQFMGIFWRKWK